jgi:hypothetical protein
VFVGNFMVDMFAKCSEIGYAPKIFDEILENNVVLGVGWYVGKLSWVRMRKLGGYLSKLYLKI